MEVSVEVRDGLAYLPGSDVPFTGETVAAFPDAPHKAQMVDGYKEGKRHGDTKELYKSGKVKRLRRYENGEPKYAANYYQNGQLKYETPLNSKDVAEGAYRRWFEDGTLQAEATFDADENWHGESKEYDRSGKLSSHLRFDHGQLVEILFETPEAKAVREEHGVVLKDEAK